MIDIVQFWNAIAAVILRVVIISTAVAVVFKVVIIIVGVAVIVVVVIVMTFYKRIELLLVESFPVLKEMQMCKKNFLS